MDKITFTSKRSDRELAERLAEHIRRGREALERAKALREPIRRRLNEAVRELDRRERAARH